MVTSKEKSQKEETNMSVNGPTIAKIIQYKDIEDSLQGGFVPLYLFILEQMKTDKFLELNTLYNTLTIHIAKILKEIYPMFPPIEELTEEEKKKVTEALSEKIEEDK